MYQFPLFSSTAGVVEFLEIKQQKYIVPTEVLEKEGTRTIGDSFSSAMRGANTTKQKKKS